MCLLDLICVFSHLGMEADEDIVNFLDHHENVLIEASEDELNEDGSSLQQLTEGQRHTTSDQQTGS